MADDTENTPQEAVTQTPDTVASESQSAEAPETTAPESIPAETAPQPEPETAQTGGGEPMPETPSEGAAATAEAPKEEPRTYTEVEQTPTKRSPTASQEPPIKERLNVLRKLAHATILLRREKKLQKIMELFAKHPEITNDKVQGLLRVSDATATRYLSLLVKRGKITRHSTTGRDVSYTKL